jgi:excinuclease ABC subunit B
VNGRVVMYADRMSEAMRIAIDETNRRRAIQEAYNTAHGITPTTISKSIQDILVRRREEKRSSETVNIEVLKRSYNVLVPKEKRALVKALEQEMFELAKNLEFERAAVVRDEISRIKDTSTTGEE